MTPRALIISSVFAACSLAVPGLSRAESPPQDPLRFPFAGGSVKVDVEIGAQVVTEKDAFWNLSESFAPGAGFAPDMTFGEAYLKTGVVFTRTLEAAKLEAGLSAVASQTFGEDVFASRGEGDIELENAYASVELAIGAKSKVKLSGGAQPYRVGSGMLIADGAADGFERGALIFGPRQAFEQTVLAKYQYGAVSVEAFHLDARELPSSDSRTVVEGLRMDVAQGETGFVGFAYGRVPESEAPYVQAAPGGLGMATIINNGREGMSFWNGYFKLSPLASMPTLWVSGDFAMQRNSRINMSATGGRIEIGNAFVSAPTTPTLSYSYQVFSGDNPNTPKLERFDPLFYDGGQNGWASGTNGAFVFINSNIRAHKVTLVTQPSPRDILTLRYAKVSADQLRSPIQFGQGTRPILGPGGIALVTGVTSRPLSDDVLIEYTRILTPNIFLSAGLGHSWIGRGQSQAASAPTMDWTGAFANIVFRY